MRNTVDKFSVDELTEKLVSQARTDGVELTGEPVVLRDRNARFSPVTAPKGVRRFRPTKQHSKE